jgi:hypothetical protein
VSPKKIMALGVVCAALLVAMAVPAVAGAATAAPATVGARTPGRDHRLGQWLIAHRRQIRRDVLSISAKAIGLSRQDLAADLRSGQSLADVAGAHHVATASVVAALLAAAQAKVTKVAAQHQLTAAQMSKIRQKLESLVVKLVHHRFGKLATANAAPNRA